MDGGRNERTSMDALTRIIHRINTQLSDLTASQRLSIGLCVVVIVGSFVWLVRWSAEPEYVRLLEEPLTLEQMAAARQMLPEGRYKIVGEHVFVPPDERHELFWKLQSAGALPADTSVTFAKLIEDDSPFRPESENHFRRRVALQNELAKVIMSSRMVKSAGVFLTDSTDRRVQTASHVPTASIQVTMASGFELDEEIVRSCAAIVAGAVPGLAAHRVTVVDGGTLRSYSPPDPESRFGQGILQETIKTEEYYRKKLLAHLSYMAGVRVSVAVQLDTAQKQTREITYGEPAVAEETSHTTDTQSGGGGGESGVGPNVGQALARSAGDERSTSEETKTSFQDQVVESEKTTVQYPLAPLRIAASIGVPRSYVAAIVRDAGAGTEPTRQEIDSQFEVESARVRGIVKTIIMASGDGDVAVELFSDSAPGVTVLADGSVVSAGMGNGAGALSLLKQYGPEGVLGAMALTGLLLLSRLARRSAAEAASAAGGRPESERDSEEGGGVTLTASMPPIGSAMPGDFGALMGVEIQEDAIRGDELTQQVSRFVQENPEGAARLIRRWTDDAR